MAADKVFGMNRTARRMAGNTMARAARARAPQDGSGVDPSSAFEMTSEWKDKWARGLCSSMGHSPGDGDFEECVQSMKSRVGSPVRALARLGARGGCGGCKPMTAHAPARRAAQRFMMAYRRR